jgi:hypothetical protein
MVRQADVIGVATVQSATPRLEPRTGMICTDFRLAFSDVWKGDPGREFVLVKPGGELQGEKVTVPGHEFVLKPGEPIVVFASPSNLGNHVVIGLRQGLYRVGSGSEQPVFRVSEHPLKAGSSSALTLRALKDEVWRALGRPVEPAPDPPRANPSSTEKASDNGVLPAATSVHQPTAAVPPPPVESRLWGGLLIISLIVLVGIVLLLYRKKQGLNR